MAEEIAAMPIQAAIILGALIIAWAIFWSR